MPKTIRVDDELYRYIQEHAEPLVDTPNSVLRRILKLDKKKPLSRKPKPE